MSEAKSGSRGPSKSVVEDMELCKAFVAASEDVIVGSGQKDAAFKTKLNENCNILIKEHNKWVEPEIADAISK